MAARSDDLAEPAAMIPADFSDGHAFHAREELQQAWRKLSTMDGLVNLAFDVEQGHRVHQPGDAAVSTVVQLVEVAHGGNANDLGLSGLVPRIGDLGQHPPNVVVVDALDRPGQQAARPTRERAPVQLLRVRAGPRPRGHVRLNGLTERGTGVAHLTLPGHQLERQHTQVVVDQVP
ncbi:hypothetical protein ACQPZF_29790 [Actinosynnema sp. CS-041913]|uniref:hypothetical protein n=1 Tax=Actinosynnema sp. CS-041913 TaxID=3239917 RepID=UPI003D8EB1C8